MMNTPQIAFLTPVAKKTADELYRLLPNGFELKIANQNDREEHRELLKEAHYAFLGGTHLDADLIQSAPKLKLIQKWGIGVDKIDLIAAKDRGVPVAITNGANASQVAEHAILLMLATLRKLPYARQSLIDGQWINSELRVSCSQLVGKTVGIFGLGNIAKHVIKQLRGFDTPVIYYTRTRLSTAEEARLNIQYVDFKTLLQQSDILSLHAPLTDATKNIINAENLALMKKDAIIINTARGELIDEDALVKAIQTKNLRGAGLDVFANEPPNPDNPLLKLDGVVATPHAGASVIEAVISVIEHGMNNIANFEKGIPLDPADWIVRPPAV
ncbi:2-hydroxyacid dehydrogenase [Polynucleobacter kasalickyi]|uniref:D-3-phosphoglycerate dehydrogenase n=1 Tax=Polynucleobacter kasalickyi TaxID=1938817 RepID=A0A1W2A348_9BURK|nr:2-hydroxyacid dehydrogenase [Polynucleobacter kasalickyi]SMC54872.1 D-3-phosphoglycerate dehydrogenase [Polynucleobacter kasalickyi]